MNTNDAFRRPDQSSHMLILVSYTLLSLGLMGETLLMGWELWALPLIAAGVGVAWAVHIRQRLPGPERLWVYTALMMAIFFFYGIHVTSAYDMSVLMMIVMIIYTVTGQSALVTFCQVTYYVTLAYDILVMIAMGTVWDSLLISRTCLHVVLVFMAGWLARFIIRQWDRMFRESDARFEALNRTARRMSGFMGNLSHELRTPVNAILGTTGIMLNREWDDATRGELATVRDAGRRMARQVGDILDFSEIETGRVVVTPERYALASMLNDLVSALRPRLSGALELIIDVDADTPAELTGDVSKLRKLLFHLIDNGLKYTREGGVYVRITHARQEYGVNLRVEVRDTGIGMSREEIERVTNRFYQADSGRAVRTGGLGLGLPIVAGFVRAMGGFMMIDSAPGAGTVVRLSIPQQVEDERGCMSVAQRERVCLGGFLNISKFKNPEVREFYNTMIHNIVRGLETPMHRVDNAADLEKLVQKTRLTHLFVGDVEYRSATAMLEALAERMRVIVVAEADFALAPDSRAMIMPKPFYCFPVAELLNTAWDAVSRTSGRLMCPGIRAMVVDDEPMNLNVAAGILRRYGMRVTTAPSGQAAIELCEAEPFDLIFMDHMMPEMDGIEAMNRIRQRWKSIKIVALTANALSTAREMFLKEGFDGFLSKPIEIPELERVLKRVLPEEVFDYEDSEPEPAPAAVSDGGIDRAMGLRYCQGDAALYEDVLRQFAADAPRKHGDLAAFADGGDCRGYAIAVHALKSSAKLIGARALSERAAALEAAAKAGEIDVIREVQPALFEGLEAAASAIRSDYGDAPEEDSDDIIEFLPDGEA